MIYALCLIGGAAIGALIGWLWASSRTQSRMGAELAEARSEAGSAASALSELRNQLTARDAELQDIRTRLAESERQRTEASTRLEEAAKGLEEQKRAIQEAQSRLADTFKALSKDALQSNNQSFLELAKESLARVLSEAKGELGKEQQAITATVKPLQETLKQYQEHVKALEATRQREYGGLQERLRALGQVEEELKRQTGSLVTALRTPQIRGRWGEMQLHRVVELAGMSEFCDYTEQVNVTTEDGRLRPDMIISLPGNREVVVDAKVPLDAYLDAVGAKSEGERASAMKRHAQQVRNHVKALAEKGYWNQFEHAPDLVVLFIPGECFFSAALEMDASILEEGFAKRVCVATPTTLFALLCAVAYGWRQEQLSQQVEQISRLGKELHDRMGILADHLQRMGRNLASTVTAYNEAVASMETRLLPSARRFGELGISTKRNVPTLEPVDRSPRPAPQLESGMQNDETEDDGPEG